MQSRILILEQIPTHQQECQRLLEKAGVDAGGLDVVWQFVGWEEKLKVEVVRSLLAQAAQSGGARATLFVLPHFNLASSVIQNTLLKFLEEPPTNVGIVLLATSTTGILPTITSRCTLTYHPGQTESEPSPLTTVLLTDYQKHVPASLLARHLVQAATSAHKIIKKDHSELSLTSYSTSLLMQTLTDLTGKLDQATTTAEIATIQPLIATLTRSLTLIRANVSAKNVFWWLANDVIV